MRLEFLECQHPERTDGINHPPLDVVRDALALVGCVLFPDFAANARRWSPLELVIAYDYAMREHISAADNPIRRRPRPSFVVEKADVTEASSGESQQW